MSVLAVLASIHDTTIKLDPRLLQLASGVVIPLVVGLITKAHAARGLKAILNFLLSALAGGLSVALATNGSVVLSTWVFGILTTFVTSISSYYGFWEPTGVAAKVVKSTPNVGLGSGTPAPPSPSVWHGGTGTANSAYAGDDILPGQIPPEVAEPPSAQLDPAPASAVKKAQAAKKPAKKK